MNTYFVVCFLLGNPPVSEFVCQRFRTLCFICRDLPAYEDGTDRVFWNVGLQNSDAGELPRRKHTTFRTRRKFEIKKNTYFVRVCWMLLCQK